jgi:hypothetical protein
MSPSDEESLERKRANNRARQQAFVQRQKKSKNSEAYRLRRREADKKSKQKKKPAAKTVGNQEATTERVGEEAMSILAAAATGASVELDANSAVSSRENSDEGDAATGYVRGTLIYCPPTLHGYKAEAARVLEGLIQYLHQNWKSDVMTKLIRLSLMSASDITGIRQISGNRYEFYVSVKNKIPAAFKTILMHSEKIRLADNDLEFSDDDLSRLIQIIVGFAAERACATLQEGYSLQNFSLIVSLGQVRSQDMHIDLNYATHFQFGMLCSPKGELTSEYGCFFSNNLVQKGYTLTQIWDDLPAGLQEKLDRIKEIQPLLDGYGPLLSQNIEQMNVKYTVPFGTIVRLPGRVMHCGPEVTDPSELRAVLFFTATPKEDSAMAYNPETQYCRTTIIADILYYSWYSLDTREKQYMLSKWAEVGLSKDSEDALIVNMVHKHLKVIGKAIKKTWEKGLDLATLIKTIALDPSWEDRDADQWRDWWIYGKGKIYTIPRNT